MKRALLSILTLFSVVFSFSQKENSWNEVEREIFPDVKNIRVKSLPTDYKLYKFDYTNFASKLVNVPKRGNFSGIHNNIDGKIFDFQKTILYSTINNEAFVIQGRGLPFNDQDNVSIGFKALESGF